MATVQVVILAAGKGTRMCSKLPKVLHHLAGKSLLEHVITTVAVISNQLPIIIYGYQGEIVCETLKTHPAKWIEQTEQLGTGHAVQQALPAINGDDNVLILYGDVPLIASSTLKKLIDNTPAGALSMLTATLAEPKGYGRIKRDIQGSVISIVEEKDATEKERAITEINPGIYYISGNLLKKLLPVLKNNNAQKEFYLTDIIALATDAGIHIHTEQPSAIEEIMGVNDRVQLAQLERFYQHQQAEKLMRQGVTLIDPHRLDVRGDVEIAQDVIIDVNVILQGKVIIGKGSKIGPHCILTDVQIGENVEVRAHSIIEDAVIATESTIGPFARIRPGTKLASKTHIGNFVEIKNSVLGEGSKVNHLSYIGDSEVGRDVNVGAGTITCNYDGVHKHKTIIKDHVFIGSDTQLVAPVVIGEGATIGAGSTITKDVPPHELALSHRLEQRSIKGWRRPKKG